MLDWLYTAISWIMLRWHDLFSTFLPASSGLSWALSIMFLVITIRTLLFRFFVKQVKTQRAMQELQPKIQELRQKYKNDRQAQSREILALQQEAGVNMLGGCLPVLLQAPVFLALFHVLRWIAPNQRVEYTWTKAQMASASNAKLFGAPIPADFRGPADRLAQLGGSMTATHIVTVVLIISMVVATFLTQRMVMSRTTTQLDSQQAMIQKLMLYGMPASLAVSGFFFPVGVLVYWFTNNVWTLGQQFYILRRMPVKTPTAMVKKPTIDPKLLAPKPGAKPLHPKNRRLALGAESTQTAPAGDGTRPTKSLPPPRAKPVGPAGKAAATTPANGSPAKPGNRPAGGAPGSAAVSPAANSQTPNGSVSKASTGAGKGGAANGTPAQRAPAKQAARSKSGKKRRR